MHMSTFKNIKLLGVAAALGASLLMAAPAQASYGTVTAKLDSINPAGPNTGGGVFNFTRTGGTFTGTLLPNSPANKFIGICLDLFEGISVGSTHTWVVDDLENAPIDVPPTLGARANDLRKLIGGALVGGLLSNASLLTADQAAALQLAVWEIVNETGGTYNVNSGVFNVGSRGTTTTRAAANTLLAGLSGYTAAKNLYALTNATYQDFLVQTPIPAAAWLLGSGLLGLFGISRRRRQVVA
jgi:hypothetical protein